MQTWLFLALIMLIAYLGKNMSLMIATGFVMLVKLLPFTDKLFDFIHAKGINWGVIIITIAVLVPIATVRLGLRTC